MIRSRSHTNDSIGSSLGSSADTTSQSHSGSKPSDSMAEEEARSERQEVKQDASVERISKITGEKEERKCRSPLIRMKRVISDTEVDSKSKLEKESGSKTAILGDTGTGSSGSGDTGGSGSGSGGEGMRLGEEGKEEETSSSSPKDNQEILINVIKPRYVQMLQKIRRIYIDAHICYYAPLPSVPL